MNLYIIILYDKIKYTSYLNFYQVLGLIMKGKSVTNSIQNYTKVGKIVKNNNIIYIYTFCLNAGCIFNNQSFLNNYYLNNRIM